MKVRILEARTTRVLATFQVDDASPDDGPQLLLIAAREAKRLRRPATDIRIQAWHQRRGWVEHRST